MITIRAEQIDDGTTAWIKAFGTWSYSSADAPIFVATVNLDLTGKIWVGDKIRLTQTTDKYFIVHAISFAAGTTTLTIYGGTDYTLANAAISSPYYSHQKSPLGFPMSPAKWSVTTTDTSNRSQANPVQNTWYNLGSISISVPIGAWKPSYFVIGEGVPTASNTVGVLVTLSTANNSQSNAAFTRKYQIASATDIQMSYVLADAEILEVTVKTTYYLNTMQDQLAGASMTSINNRGDKGTTTIRLVDAYL